jgi:hypothetical protein
VLVGDPGQFIEPAARQHAQAIEMRLQPPNIVWLEIESDEIAQAAVDRVEILAGAIRRDVAGAAVLRWRGAQRSLRCRCVHIEPLYPSRLAGWAPPAMQFDMAAEPQYRFLADYSKIVGRPGHVLNSAWPMHNVFT